MTMRDDRHPLRAAVIVEEPTGKVTEMDVCLYGQELKPTKGYVLEPWVRVAEQDDWLLSAGVSVSRHDEEDGA